MFEALAETQIGLINGFLNRRFEARTKYSLSHARLMESMRYSLLQEGAKRFRPVLAMLTAEACGGRAEAVAAFAAAIECVHTYSLIHDDLPAMDNDDWRRGKPTNHRAFDEATAILAGDALLTEAFCILHDGYRDDAKLAIDLVELLAEAAGHFGMVGGQAIDLAAKRKMVSLDELKVMHALKTGALIRVAVVGGARICGASPERQRSLNTFAENLGLAFQVADDLLDFNPEKPEPASFPAVMGVEPTRAYLQELTEASLDSLRMFSRAADPLREIARRNRDRRT